MKIEVDYRLNHFCFVDIDDERGHILKRICVDPDFKDGKAIRLRNCASFEDDIYLTEFEDCFIGNYSYDEKNIKKDKDIVPFFYDYKGEDDYENRIWEMKGEVQEAILEAINEAIKNDVMSLTHYVN